MIKISIVTISFNQVNYLRQCIESILDQDYPNLEYIVIDGGSTDGSVEIIREYQNRLTYWGSEKDDGPAQALNKGLRMASGVLFGYINSDDFLLPGALSRLSKIYQSYPECDVFCGSGYILREPEKMLIKIVPTRWNLGIYRAGLYVMMQQSIFVKREILSGRIQFNEGNRINWDGELLIDLAISNAKFKRYMELMSVFRIYDGSITSRMTTNIGNEKFLKEVKRLNEKIDATGLVKIRSRTVWMLWLLLFDFKGSLARLFKTKAPYRLKK